MKYTIKSKYLIFPVNTLSFNKKLTFIANTTVYRLKIKLDNINPNFYAYINVARFIGQTINISVEPEMELVFQEADEMTIANLYHEPMRPQLHFTTKNGWINDPNGLIYLDGIYHMFYQHNPTEPNWANMHWGHAESRDLIHWEEKDIALFPDDRGGMWSGSAILDDKNLLGKNTETNKAALLFYTTTSPFCQHMSYSTDNFKTIENYSKEPVVPHIKSSNRDPKVVFCEELNCYIMVLYLTEDTYCLLKSLDLTNWEEIQQIHLYGDNECPDIFPLKDKDGKRKWIIMGANDKYFVGRFEAGRFVAEQPELALHYGISGYAGQSFSNLPNGRVVRMVWDRWDLPAPMFKGQMGIPMEMSLAQYNDTYYLQANPIKEIKQIYKDTRIYNDIALISKSDFKVPLEKCAHLLRLTSANLNKGKFVLRIFGIMIEFDYMANTLKVGDCSAPISITRNNLDVTIVVDCCSVEIFSDGGKIFVSCLDGNTFNDYNFPYLSIEAAENIQLNTLEINSLHSIWNK